MKKRGNTEGPDRPTDDRNWEDYGEVNPRPGLTGDELMSADINGPESDYEGWNGVYDLPQEDYKDLLDCCPCAHEHVNEEKGALKNGLPSGEPHN